MAEITNELLKQAIADAEAVRQTAIANAKIALEETFTPQIKSMLARRLRAEATDDTAHEDGCSCEVCNPSKTMKNDAPPMESEGSTKETPFQDATAVGGESPVDTSTIGSSDNKEPSPESFDSSDIDHGGEQQTDSATDWYDDWSEKDFDLDEVIKELEADIASELSEDTDDDEKTKVDATADANTSPDAAMKDTVAMAAAGDDKPEAPAVKGMEDEAMNDPMKFAQAHGGVVPETEMKKGHEAGEGEGEGEEELDLEQILRELEADARVEDTDASQMAHKMEALQNELAEYRKVVNVLRGKLNEVNLLNAKLLYTNRIFRKEGLTNEQKVTILESFDRAINVREVKMVYTTLVEALTVAAKSFRGRTATVKVVTEGLASKPTASTAPKKEILEENTVAKRLQQLAGIL